jgi:putative acetyltransferase
MISPMKIETALPTHFERLVAIWESSVRATHHFLQESDIAALRPLLLNAYLPNLKVVIARDDAGVIHGFLGVDETALKCCLLTTRAAEGVGNCCCKRHRSVRREQVDVNEQNPQGVAFYAIWGLSRSDARNWTGRGIRFRCCICSWAGRFNALPLERESAS